VDLSFLYEMDFLTMDHAKMEQNSPYGFMEHFFSAASKVVELQLSSSQIQEFIRFAEVSTLIAYAGKPHFTFLCTNHTRFQTIAVTPTFAPKTPVYV
jgi:hypothetical protein